MCVCFSVLGLLCSSAEMHCTNVGCSEPQHLSGPRSGTSVLLSGAAVTVGSPRDLSAAEDTVKVNSCVCFNL